MATADSPDPRERFSLLEGGARREPEPEEVRGGAWVALHTALTLGAGHGLFLVAAVTRGGLPSLRDLGGAATAPFVLFFLACVPLAAASLLLRRPIEGLAPGLQRGLAAAVWAACTVAFGGYLARMLGA